VNDKLEEGEKLFKKVIAAAVVLYPNRYWRGRKLLCATIEDVKISEKAIPSLEDDGSPVVDSMENVVIRGGEVTKTNTLAEETANV